MSDTRTSKELVLDKRQHGVDPAPVDTFDDARDLNHAALLKKLPHVRPELVEEIREQSPWVLQRRVLIQADWLGSYSQCLDGMSLNIGVESARDPKDIRRIVEKLRTGNEPESWRPTNQQCDQIIGALEDHEWSGFSREDIRRLVNVIDQHRPSQPPVPAPSTSEIATFIRCREAIKAVDDGDSPAYAHAMEVIDDLISGAAHVRASQPPFPGLLERCGRCGYGHNVGNPCPPTGAL